MGKLNCEIMYKSFEMGSLKFEKRFVNEEIENIGSETKKMIGEIEKTNQ